MAEDCIKQRTVSNLGLTFTERLSFRDETLPTCDRFMIQAEKGVDSVGETGRISVSRIAGARRWSFSFSDGLRNSIMPMTFSVASINAGTLTTALTLSLVWVCLQVATASPQATDPLPTEEVAVAKQVEISDEPRAIDRKSIAA